MKSILLISSIVLLTGCTTATNYTELEKQMNNGHPPKMFFGMKVYPEYAKSLLTTPMAFPTTPSCSVSRTTYINTTTTIKSSNGTTRTYTTKGYIRR